MPIGSAGEELFQLFMDSEVLELEIGLADEEIKLTGLLRPGTEPEPCARPHDLSFEVPVMLTVTREAVERAERIRRNREQRRAQAPGWNRSLRGMR